MRNLKLIKTIDFSGIWRLIRSELKSEHNDICIFNDHCEGNYCKISFDAADEAVLIALAKFMYAHTGLRTMNTLKLALYDNTTSKSLLDLRKESGIININMNSVKAQLVLDSLALYKRSETNVQQVVAGIDDEVYTLFNTVCPLIHGEYLFKWHDISTYSNLVELLNKLYNALIMNIEVELFDTEKYPLLHKWFVELERVIYALNHHSIECDSICYETTVGIMMLLAICLYNILDTAIDPLKIKGLALICSMPVLDIDELIQGKPHTFHAWNSNSIVTFWDACIEISAIRGVDICTKSII